MLNCCRRWLGLLHDPASTLARPGSPTACALRLSLTGARQRWARKLDDYRHGRHQPREQMPWRWWSTTKKPGHNPGFLMCRFQAGSGKRHIQGKASNRRHHHQVCFGHRHCAVPMSCPDGSRQPPARQSATPGQVNNTAAIPKAVSVIPTMLAFISSDMAIAPTQRLCLAQVTGRQC